MTHFSRLFAAEVPVPGLGFALFLAVLLPLSTFGQVKDHLNVSAGAGFSVPTERTGSNLNTGWNFDLRGGYNATERLLLDLDFTYNRSNLNRAALARVGQPGGHATTWSLTFNPMYRFFPQHRTDVYVTGGYGLYYRNVSLTQPVTGVEFFCDPFFGFCEPVLATLNQVVASFTTYKGGFNAGTGLEFRVGSGRWKVFSEARYSRMFTTHGDDLTLIPVTFGIRW